jgi:hypothetical protein
MKVEFGVEDVVYFIDGERTSGEVAAGLEKDYGIMQAFFDMYGQTTADNLAQAMVGEFETGKFNFDPKFTQADFHDFLSYQQVESVGIPGVPTERALKGRYTKGKLTKQARKIRGKRAPVEEGSRRPSFIDTGLYQASFRAWVEK